MKQVNNIPEKIYTIEKLRKQIAIWKFLGKKVAFTNGCFDILHKGHIFSLSEAAATADILIVGLNADTSVKRLKGENRPVNDENARALLLASLVMVDAVILFEEDTPQQLIATLLPDILVKGGDYTVEQIAGSREVIENGGKVIINPIIEGFSTTGIIEKMKRNS